MPTQTVPIHDVSDPAPPGLRQGIEMLTEGRIVVLPTETVYGAAGVISHPRALERLKALRGEENERAFTIHVGSPESAEPYLGEIGELARRMMRKLWPGPVALMFEAPEEVRQAVARRLNIAESDVYDQSTITLRCPDHPVASRVLRQVREPVALTMAPTHGNQPARRGDELSDEFQERVDLVLDAGMTRYAKPSTIVRVDGNRYEIVRVGVYDERIIDRLLQTTILFVCSGNTCRSPMAEAIARRVIADRLQVAPDQIEGRGITVLSAGSHALPGAPAAAHAVDAVKALGADLSRHRSRPLSVELIHQADIIFTMSRSHAQAVTALAPSAAGKVATLSPRGEVDDPIGSELPVYTELAGQLREMIERRLNERSLP